LNLKPAQVRKKIEAYEKEQIILGYKAVINDDKLNLDHVKAVIEVKITPEREGGFNRIANRIAKFDGVTFVFDVGRVRSARVRRGTQPQGSRRVRVRKKLATLEGVLSTATHFMLKNVQRSRNSDGRRRRV